VVRLVRGRLTARMAQSAADVARAQRLRHQCFLASRGLGPPGGQDVDGFDAACDHVLVEDSLTGAVLGCFRLLFLPFSRMGESYSAQFYDLTPLASSEGMTMELGRFCIDPAVQDADVLRLSWAAITRLVDSHKVRLMYGCTSFPGADPACHAEALALLRRNHQAPQGAGPRPKAAQSVPLPAGPLDALRAQAGLPPLLRTYLAMGGWVSDHAVIDPALDTLHVFTAVAVDRIPAARARALRALAGSEG
jgi:L-ornithine Nalpha-acyltransferase